MVSRDEFGNHGRNGAGDRCQLAIGVWFVSDRYKRDIMQNALIFGVALLVVGACSSSSAPVESHKARLDRQILECTSKLPEKTSIRSAAYENCVLSIIQEDCIERMPMIDSNSAVESCMRRSIGLYQRPVEKEPT